MTPILFALLVQAEPKVSIDLPISPLTVIAREVSAQTKEPYKVTGYDPERNLFVQVKAMPASRLRQALATATGGKWAKAGEVWHLALPNPEDHEQEIFARKVEAWRKALPQFVALTQEVMDSTIRDALELKKKPADWDRHLAERQLSYKTPMTQFMVSTLLSLPPSELGSLRIGERKVYSPTPNLLQKQLPASVAASLPKLKDAFAKMSLRVEALAPEENGQTPGPASPISFYRTSTDLSKAVFPLLVLSRPESIPDTITAEVLLFDKEGKRVYNTFHFVDPRQIDDAKPKAPAKKSPLADLNQPLVFEGDEKKVAEDLSAVFFSGSRSKLKPQLSEVTRARFLQMDKVDPLVYGATDAFRMFAKAIKKQVVVRVDDSALNFQSWGKMMGQPYSLKVAISSCLGPRGRSPLDFESDDDLLVIKPVLNGSGRSLVTLDRRALASFLRAVDSGQDTFEQVADICAQARAPEDTEMASILAYLFGGMSEFVWQNDGAFQTMRLYGRLNPSFRRQACNGGVAAPLSSLDKESSDAVRSFILSSPSIVTLSPEAVNAIRARGVPEERLDDQMSNGNDFIDRLQEEPTVRLAQIPFGNTMVRVKVVESPAVFPFADDEIGYHLIPCGPEGAAQQILSAGRSPGAVMPKFLSGSHKKLTFTFVLSENSRLYRTCEKSRCDVFARKKPLEEMPEEFRSKVQQALKNMTSRNPPTFGQVEDL